MRYITALSEYITALSEYITALSEYITALSEYMTAHVHGRRVCSGMHKSGVRAVHVMWSAGSTRDVE